MFNKYLKIIKSYFNQAIDLISHPKSFFDSVDKQKNLRPALLFLAFLWITNSVILLIVSLFYGFVLPSFDSTIQAPSINFLQALITQAILLFINIIIGIVITLLVGLVIHLWIRIFKGQGSVKKSLQLVIYATTPTLLFGWLPLISIAATVYLLYLLFVGGQVLHGLPRTRSLIILVIIPIFLFVLTTLLQLGII